MNECKQAIRDLVEDCAPESIHKLLMKVRKADCQRRKNENRQRRSKGLMQKHAVTADELHREEWRSCPWLDAENAWGSVSWAVSSLGRVRVRRADKKGEVTEGFQTLTLNHGYLWFSRRHEGQVTWIYVHALVCQAFHGEPPFPDAQCCHIDDEQVNNRATNLRWGSPEDQGVDRRRNDRSNLGERAGLNAKLSEEQVRQIHALHAQGLLQKEIAAPFSVSQRHVSDILHGVTWPHVYEAITGQEPKVTRREQAARQKAKRAQAQNAQDSQ